MNFSAALSPDTATGQPAPTRVCFYRGLAYGAFLPESRIPVGGAERRSLMFAHQLALRPEFQVSYAVGNYGKPPLPKEGSLSVLQDPHPTQSRFDRVYMEFREQGGYRQRNFPWICWNRWHLGLAWQVPVIAFDHLVWRKLPVSLRMPCPKARPFFRNLECDVVCLFGAGIGAADIVASCRAHGLKSVLFLVHDVEVDAATLRQSDFVPKLGDYGPRVRYSLAKADAIVAQTVDQQKMLAANYGRKATLIRNPIDATLAPGEVISATPRHVLWIGRAEPNRFSHKRPELLLKLAAACPEIPFLAVLNKEDPVRFDSLCAARPHNLKIVERVPPAEIGGLYREAGVYVSTALSEGFPNTFLEAAKYSVPIVSLTVDPDGFLSEHGCGVCCQGEFETMVAAVQRYWHDRGLARQVGETARSHIQREHNLAAQVDKLAKMLQEVCRAAS